MTTTLLVAIASPAQALAEEKVATPEPVATPDPAAAAPAPAPATAAAGTLTVSVEGVGGEGAAVLVGQRIRVRGTLSAFAADEKVLVRFYRRGRKVRAKEAVLQPSADASGQFALSYRPDRAGMLTVRAFHVPTPAIGSLRAKAARPVDVLPRRVGPRSGRSSIRALQRRLAGMGYVVGSRGAFDGRTARAVLAFRKVTGMARTSSASKPVMRAIARGRGAFKIRRPEKGRHVEADLSRQVIALIQGGRVRRIYPVSSGAPGSPTVVGSFRVYLKTPGTNAKGMVHSSYFIRGYATHGYPSVPVYPASHGCLRVPIPDAATLFDWMRIGTPVEVYH
jgi:hypothetical protein